MISLHLLVVLLALVALGLAALKVPELPHLSWFYAGIFFVAVVLLGVA